MDRVAACCWRRAVSAAWKSWERAIAVGFTAAGLPAKRRGVTDEARDGRIGDIEFEGTERFVVEARDRKSVSPWEAIRDAEMAAQATDSPGIPVGFLRRKHGRGRPAEKLVAMRPSAFFQLARLAFATDRNQCVRKSTESRTPEEVQK